MHVCAMSFHFIEVGIEREQKNSKDNIMEVLERAVGPDLPITGSSLPGTICSWVGQRTNCTFYFLIS